MEPRSRVVKDGRRILRATSVFDTYWRFAAERQRVLMRRLSGHAPPWTQDPWLSTYRFTNAYRAADRVSQYLIRRVIYDGPQAAEEVFFRVLLFKIFNRIGTWEKLIDRIGPPTWRTFDLERYARAFDEVFQSGDRLYSAAYIMPSPPMGYERKHRNHLSLLQLMMKEGVPSRIANASSLSEVYAILKSFPSIGPFLAFQFSIDLNYSEIIDFSEMDFVVAGPGAREGIRKCFSDTAGLSDEDVIAIVAQIADDEFHRQSIEFRTLWGRKLQLIDYQNLFCEVAKYARVAHPEFSSTRKRIKQRFRPNQTPLNHWYPPKWRLSVAACTADIEVDASCR